MVRAMQVSSAVIPAAGAGTRFLPATKAVPKELMPIGDTPAIQLIIDEALGAGIEHIVVISNHAKPAIERYFLISGPRKAVWQPPHVCFACFWNVGSKKTGR